MTHIFHRYPKQTLPIAVEGVGIEIIDQHGKRYIDACGGAAVSSLGHSHPKIIEAICKQAEKMSYAHTAFFTTQAAENLAHTLATLTHHALKYVYFVSGGSEAIETALKLARQYFVEKGESQRTYFIARQQSYHGNTLGALAIGGNVWRREPFLPVLMKAHHVSPCHAYRHRQENESDDSYVQRLVDELEAKIISIGGDNVAAFVAETIVGATLGAVPPVENYFKKIRALCDKYGILLILDEVMCGMGRTGEWFAYEREGIIPDIVAIAKGLGAGYQPIGAMLCSDTIYDTIINGSGFFQHGHTYIGHAIACAAAQAVLNTIKEENLLDNVRQRGRQLQSRLREVFAEHPHVGDVRGRGLFVGLELVASRETRAPIPAVHRTHSKIKQEAMLRGLMVYPMGGTIDGVVGDHVLLAPPFICTSNDIDEIVDRLFSAVCAATTQNVLLPSI